MSRIAKKPIEIPASVDINLQEETLTIKGPKGTLVESIHAAVNIEKVENNLIFSAKNKSKSAISLSGTARAKAANMVQGVSSGFEKKLQLVGVGYRAQAKGNVLELTLGFSHPVSHQVPDGITVETPSQTEVVVKGADKQIVGQVASEIRAYRPPEPYKGKGVRYADERIALKDAKKK
ncbi:MAG: 50S ribosomal protein L6 [Gammaproteobacteria bacterium]|nr:50S ribosomal protein L6 [Gammaproteobacteria bacterium]